MSRNPPERPDSDEGLRRAMQGDHLRIQRDFDSFSPVIPIAAAVFVLIVVAAIVRLLFLG